MNVHRIKKIHKKYTRKSASPRFVDLKCIVLFARQLHVCEKKVRQLEGCKTLLLYG